jgi:hypothetical protein
MPDETHLSDLLEVSRSLGRDTSNKSWAANHLPTEES